MKVERGNETIFEFWLFYNCLLLTPRAKQRKPKPRYFFKKEKRHFWTFFKFRQSTKRTVSSRNQEERFFVFFLSWDAEIQIAVCPLFMDACLASGDTIPEDAFTVLKFSYSANAVLIRDPSTQRHKKFSTAVATSSGTIFKTTKFLQCNLCSKSWEQSPWGQCYQYHYGAFSP